jgi:putative hydrolase of the HAD superfamily
MPIDTVLMDMGGVILEMKGTRGFPVTRLDFRGREALLAKLRSMGAHLDADELERRLFAPWREAYAKRQERGREASWASHLARLRRRTGVRGDDLELLETWFRPYGEQLEPYEDAGATLAEIRRRGLSLALVSNVPLPGELYRGILERHGLARFFDALHFSYDEGTRKPSPALLRSAMAAVGASPRGAVMVGDRLDRDIVAGRAAGVRTVWLDRGTSPGPAPDETISSLSELPAALDRLS